MKINKQFTCRLLKIKRKRKHVVVKSYFISKDIEARILAFVVAQNIVIANQE